MTVLLEWRKWPDGWTFTGTAGINLESKPHIRRPNTQLFSVGVDPNLPPVDQAHQRLRIEYARLTIPRLQLIPNSEAAIACVAAMLNDALDQIGNATQDTCEDF